jgi:hypothetical protein
MKQPHKLTGGRIKTLPQANPLAWQYSPRSGAPRLGRDQAADWWTNPRSARRTASSKSRSIKRPARNCSQATIRSRKMPRFSAGKPSAAFQMVRSCESDSANMRPWCSEGSGCQPLSCEAHLSRLLHPLRLFNHHGPLLTTAAVSGVRQISDVV